MSDCSIDAIKIAKSIQKDELDILRGKEFKFRVKIKKRKRMKKSNDGKMTLAKLAKEINSRFDSFEDSINTRINNLEKDINTRFENVEKRLDNLEVRLDNVEKRLDNLEVRLDNVEKRLDYNNLKKLPNSR